MITLKGEHIYLRALEPEDLEFIHEIENNEDIWEISNTQTPYSKYLIKQYLENAHKDIFEVKQKRFVLSDANSNVLGFVDLFDFEPIHRRVGVGIVVHQTKRGLGLGKKGLMLLDLHCKTHLNIHCLYANIAAENKTSLRIFEHCGYEKVGIKKAWNFYQGAFHDEFLYQKLFD